MFVEDVNLSRHAKELFEALCVYVTTESAADLEALHTLLALPQGERAGVLRVLRFFFFCCLVAHHWRKATCRHPTYPNIVRVYCATTHAIQRQHCGRR